MEPERCAECGFDASHLTVPDAIAALRSLRRRWHEAFEDVPDEDLRTRPNIKVWSPLEYAAHTRDVLRMHVAGLAEILAGKKPTYPSVPAEQDAPDHGHNELEPETVLDELGDAADAEAAEAEAARGPAWERTVTLGGETLTADWMIKHSVHDATHHLFDVERILRRR